MNSNDDTVSVAREHCLEVCNGLLRGELSAVEAYGQAIEKYTGSPATDELRRIRSDHSRSVTWLSMNVRTMGGKPAKESGAWGLSAAVQGAAVLFGRHSAIESLKRSEESSRTNYQLALLDDDVMTECKQMIREDLLPPIIGHLTALDRLEHAV